VSRLVARLSAWIRPASLLIVPVPAAEPAVAAWLGQERVEFDGVPLHVTVMYPFLPARSVNRAQEEAVAELARGVSPFPFTLAMLGRFPACSTWHRSRPGRSPRSPGSSSAGGLPAVRTAASTTRSSRT
jgi:hypothetical protein